MQIEDLDRLPTFHYTQMPEDSPDSPIYRETQTFRRELPRLLAEGHEGKWGCRGACRRCGCAGRFSVPPFLPRPVPDAGVPAAGPNPEP